MIYLRKNYLCLNKTNKAFTDIKDVVNMEDRNPPKMLSIVMFVSPETWGAYHL